MLLESPETTSLIMGNKVVDVEQRSKGPDLDKDLAQCGSDKDTPGR